MFNYDNYDVCSIISNAQLLYFEYISSYVIIVYYYVIIYNFE